MSNFQELIDNYPRLLRGSGPLIPGYIGPGWHPIVMRLMSEIDAMLSDELAAVFRVVQIKEKFGGLRFYFDLDGRKDFTLDIAGVGRFLVPDQDEEGKPPRPPELKRIYALIRNAEEEASHTCEICGEPGELQREGWALTLCQHHAQVRKAGGRLDVYDGC